MSDKDRRKKDGQDTGKDNKAMHEAVSARHEGRPSPNRYEERGHTQMSKATRKREEDRIPHTDSPRADG